RRGRRGPTRNIPACRPRRRNSARRRDAAKGEGAVLQKLRFNGDVVVVTGAAGGIGRATAEALAELGATTVLVGRTQAKLDEVKAALDKTGDKYEALAADVSKEEGGTIQRDYGMQREGR